jgi:hypothetical protein
VNGLKTLTPDQVARYRDTGYLAPLEGLSGQEIPSCQRLLQSFLKASGWPLDRGLQHKPHLYLKWVSDLVHHPAILDAVEDVLGSDLLVWRSSFFIKGPRDPNHTAWHQDARYWGLGSEEVVTAWIALTDSRIENGCLQVVPGSHRLGALPHLVKPGRGNTLLRGQSAVVSIPGPSAVSIRLQAGQFSLHHVRILHGSQPNGTEETRAGLAVRFIPPHVRQTGARQGATLVRGADRFGHFDLEPIPRYDYDPIALAAHTRSVRRYAAQVLREAVAEPTLANLFMIGRIAFHPKTWRIFRRSAVRWAGLAAGRGAAGPTG